MRTPLRYLIPVLAATGAAAAIAAAPTAAADPDSTLPQCTSTYAYPWDDEFYGPALIMGGGAWGNHGMGGVGMGGGIGGGHR